MRFAVILAGCGQHDGSETHEVILTLLSLEQEGVEWQAFAPDIKQACVINHLDETVCSTDSRSVLQESARLVRGKIQALPLLDVNAFDAIVFPGGLGAVTNLCDWYEKKASFEFQSDVKQVIEQAKAQKMPMGFICIAPVMIPKIYPGAQLTIGHDDSIAAQLQSMGGVHINCSADNVVIDETHRVVSTPANMVAKNINEVFVGIQKLIQALKHLSQSHET